MIEDDVPNDPPGGGPSCPSWGTSLPGGLPEPVVHGACSGGATRRLVGVWRRLCGNARSRKSHTFQSSWRASSGVAKSALSARQRMACGSGRGAESVKTSQCKMPPPALVRRRKVLRLLRPEGVGGPEVSAGACTGGGGNRGRGGAAAAAAAAHAASSRRSASAAEHVHGW